MAWLTHKGAYEELGLAYHALLAWAQERGHEQTGCNAGNLFKRSCRNPQGTIKDRGSATCAIN